MGGHETKDNESAENTWENAFPLRCAADTPNCTEAEVNSFKRFQTYLLLGCLIGILLPFRGLAQQNSEMPTRRDGQHDFDFNMGTWKTHIKYLRQLSTGSTWVEFDGTVVVQKIWDGRAQLEEIEADGSEGHFEGLTLFLYDPESRQWSQNSR